MQKYVYSQAPDVQEAYRGLCQLGNISLYFKGMNFMKIKNCKHHWISLEPIIIDNLCLYLFFKLKLLSQFTCVKRDADINKFKKT